MITLTVNGKNQEIPQETPLLNYLKVMGINPQHIAVAHNGDVIPRENLPKVTLSEGDSVEIVRAVGGG